MVDSPGNTSFKGCLEAQVVFLLGAKNFPRMIGKGKLNMPDDPRQYSTCWMIQDNITFQIYENITH